MEVTQSPQKNFYPVVKTECLAEDLAEISFMGQDSWSQTNSRSSYEALPPVYSCGHPLEELYLGNDCRGMTRLQGIGGEFTLHFVMNKISRLNLVW